MKIREEYIPNLSNFILSGSIRTKSFHERCVEVGILRAPISRTIYLVEPQEISISIKHIWLAMYLAISYNSVCLNRHVCDSLESKNSCGNAWHVTQINTAYKYSSKSPL